MEKVSAECITLVPVDSSVCYVALLMQHTCKLADATSM